MMCRHSSCLNASKAQTSRTFQQMSDNGKVEVGFEAESHGMVELFEVPF